MFQKIHRIKLRDQIRLMFAFILLMIIVLLLTFIQNVNSVSYNISREGMENAAKQLAAGLENHWQTLRSQANVLAYNNYILTFVQSETPGRRYTDYMKVLAFINSIEATNYSIDKFIYINGDILCIANTYFTDYYLLGQIKADAALDMNKPRDAEYYRLETGPGEEVRYVVVSSSYFDAYLKKPLLMVMFINKAPIISMVQNLSSDRSMFLIVDDKGYIVAASRPINGIKTEAVKSGVFFGNMDMKNKISCGAHVPGLGWKVIGISDISVRDSGEQRSLNWILLISACMAVLVTLFVLIISSNVISPVISITSFVQSIGNDYTTKRLHAEKNNEIGIMTHEINRMLDNIYQLNENMTKTQQNLYMTEISKRQIQIAALQSQINPHFLYNTLDCIRGIALKENIRSIADMASAVSKIFRYSIKAADYVYVADEINCIKDYMVIIGIRHNNRFTVSFDIEEKLLNLCIPKMILQPIVENAVFHGLEPKKDRGSIAISAYKEGDRTVFLIKDDGVGIDGEQLETLRRSLNEKNVNNMSLTEKKSIGLLNIYQRLAHTYGENFSMSINSVINAGTEIQIELMSPPRIPPATPQAPFTLPLTAPK